MSDLVSIITPMYNSMKFIESTISSVQSQTHKNWEMIIIDDCSSDASVTIVKKIAITDMRIRLVSLINNQGPSEARNEGIKLSKGKYLAFLDSDDLWDKNKLSFQIAFMKKNNYAFTYTSYDKINEDGFLVGEFQPSKSNVLYKDLLKSNQIGCLTAMVDISLINCKVIMPKIRGGREDLACWLYLLKNGNKAYCLNKKLAFYRLRKGSLTIDKKYNILYQWKLYRNIENLSFASSIYFMLHYAYNGIRKKYIN